MKKTADEYLTKAYKKGYTVGWRKGFADCQGMHKRDAAQQGVKRIGYRDWLIGFFSGGGFMYLIFLVVGIANR